MKLNSSIGNRNLLLLLVLALVSPAVIGFQYLEWYDSNHLFVGITGSTWMISYSDWYLNDWLIILLPNIFVLIPRLLFVFTLIRFNRDNADLNLVRILGLLLAGILIVICFVMMTVNSIFGTPPGVLFSIAAPVVDVRLFIPTPILLLAGIHLIKKAK
ncbi:MAG: hypothetical protein ACFFCT_14505 [Candidatus Odinarchaeota archaeon]|nr:hypothetical protein [Candidatus Thorarchaeota archaeon]